MGEQRAVGGRKNGRALATWVDVLDRADGRTDAAVAGVDVLLDILNTDGADNGPDRAKADGAALLARYGRQLASRNEERPARGVI